ncbi:MAG TPA: hypothetical protein VFR64_13800 [Methylomirabilota bacterium]|nr:hypothetical protein [Methylomirabilota bacterium]
MTRPRPSRLSSGRILKELRVAARRGDRTALAVALDQMRTLAFSPRYWEKYLLLLRNPLARVVDLLVIKQGDRIAHQKGWKQLGGGLRPPSMKLEGAAAAPSKPPRSRDARQRSRGRSPRSKRPTAARRSRPAGGAEQPLLFEL